MNTKCFLVRIVKIYNTLRTTMYNTIENKLRLADWLFGYMGFTMYNMNGSKVGFRGASAVLLLFRILSKKKSPKSFKLQKTFRIKLSLFKTSCNFFKTKTQFIWVSGSFNILNRQKIQIFVDHRSLKALYDTQIHWFSHF